MACGEAYEYLVQAAGGRSRAKPYDTTFGMQLYCNEPDAQAWYAQATHVFNLQRAAWNALIERENELGNHTLSHEIYNSATAFEDEYFALKLPSFWMGFGAGGCGEAVQAYISNIDTGKCVLDRLNQALAKVGSGTVDPGHVPPPPGERTWVPWAIAGGAALVSVGLVWLIAHRKRQMDAYWMAPPVAAPGFAPPLVSAA